MREWVKTGLAACAAVVATIGAGAAVAQVAAPPPPPGADAGPGGGPGGHGGGPHGMGGRMGDMMRMHGRMGPPSKAAQFHFRKGDARVDIKCADDEPTKACVEAGMALMDKLAAAPR